MAQSETVERILDAAEQLFAEKGFAETSLRLITSKAGVNLAAVNYHFGSKKALIQAVFSRFLGPFCASLERELDRREALTDKQDTLEELLEKASFWLEAGPERRREVGRAGRERVLRDHTIRLRLKRMLTD